MLKENEKAPDFKLQDKDGKFYTLSDFKGKKVILYFYPKDNTTGCTKEALSFKDINDELLKMNVEVIGISKDSLKSHDNFIKKYELPFLLLSDEELSAVKAYHVWQEKKMYGKTYMGICRSSFLIDEKGIIIKIWDKVKPEKHPMEVLEFLKGKKN